MIIPASALQIVDKQSHTSRFPLLDANNTYIKIKYS